MTRIQLPEQLAAFTADHLNFELSCQKLDDAFAQIFERFPLVREVLFPRNGRLNSRCLVSLNNEQIDIEGLSDLATYTLRSGDRVVVVMAAAGG